MTPGWQGEDDLRVIRHMKPKLRRGTGLKTLS